MHCNSKLKKKIFFNQLIVKEISPEYSLEGLMLKLKLHYLGHLIQRTFYLSQHQGLFQ